MKLYTGQGDKGLTALFGGGKVSKASIRVAAYGELDELNAVLGVLRTMQPWPELDALLAQLQNRLFDLGAVLASPGSTASAVSEADICGIEREIDRATAAVAPLSNFVLPGGCVLAAWLHMARTVCRRAERACIHLHEAEPLPAPLLVYLNRLSDLFFALGREANTRAGYPETLWKSTKSSGT